MIYLRYYGKSHQQSEFKIEIVVLICVIVAYLFFLKPVVLKAIMDIVNEIGILKD